MLIMTSKENHAETKSFFERHNYFGAPATMFDFQPQAMLPALDLYGKILMQSPSEVKLAPNGNGGVFDWIIKCPSVL